jgi:hypothetical protein
LVTGTVEVLAHEPQSAAEPAALSGARGALALRARSEGGYSASPTPSLPGRIRQAWRTRPMTRGRRTGASPGSAGTSSPTAGATPGETRALELTRCPRWLPVERRDAACAQNHAPTAGPFLAVGTPPRLSPALRRRAWLSSPMTPEAASADVRARRMATGRSVTERRVRICSVEHALKQIAVFYDASFLKDGERLLSVRAPGGAITRFPRIPDGRPRAGHNSLTGADAAAG